MPRIVLLLFLLLSCAPVSEGPGVAGTARVTRIVDGDTIHVDFEGKNVSVRFIGMDTPEVRHPTIGRECFGPESSAATKDLLDGEAVRLEFDRERLDRFGRTLAYIYLSDGRMVNEILVSKGFATVLTVRPNVEHQELFARAEVQARKARRGLWAAC